MYLVCLHPENENKSYKRIKVIDMREDIRKLFDQRIKQVQKMKKEMNLNVKEKID
jgi:hypothetical protein